MNSYSDNRKDHLSKYANENLNLKDKVGGTFRGKETYQHILKLETGSDKRVKYQLVKDLNLLNGVLPDMYDINKLHVYAHHLNSSQVLCYNFFRTMIDDKGHPNGELIEILKKYDLSISENALCYFEKDGSDGSEYDFFIIDKEMSISFEIKYTETEFGRAKNDDSHAKKYNAIYKKALGDCGLFDNTLLQSANYMEKDFFKYYQLYRNVIHIKNKYTFSVFLFPKENKRLVKLYEEFSNKLTGEYKNNVKCIFWEDIKDYHNNPEFDKKYFK